MPWPSRLGGARRVPRRAPQSHVAPYGHRKLATFLSERMDWESAVFHPVYFNDYITFALTEELIGTRTEGAPQGAPSLWPTASCLSTERIIAPVPSERRSRSSRARDRALARPPRGADRGGARGRATAPVPGSSRAAGSVATRSRSRRRGRSWSWLRCLHRRAALGEARRPHHARPEPPHRHHRGGRRDGERRRPQRPARSARPGRASSSSAPTANGRDSMVRLLYGGRNSLLIGVVAAIAHDPVRRRRSGSWPGTSGAGPTA